MTELILDFEAYSGIDLGDCGSSVYARHKSTSVLMCAYAFDDEKPRLWDADRGEKMHRDLRDGLRDRSVTKKAWNASFELQILEHVLGLPQRLEEWQCSMAHAATLSFPMQLSKVGPIINLPEDKQKDARGKRLIRLLCMPIKPTKKFPFKRATWVTHPSEYDELCEYCVQDVVAERAIDKRLAKWPMT